jgi:hypothetical protein
LGRIELTQPKVHEALGVLGIPSFFQRGELEMQKVVWPALGLGLAAVGLSLGLAFRRPAAEQPKAKAQDTERGDSLDADNVRSLRSEVSRLRAELRALAQKQTPAESERAEIPSTPKSREQKEPPSADEIRLQRGAQIRKVQEITKWIETEPRDEAWASAAEKHLGAVLAAEAFQGSQVVSSVCRSSLCRVEVRHKNLESRDTFELMRREVDGNFMIQHINADEEEVGDGTLRSVAIFTRPGHESENPLFDMMYSRGPS